MATIRQKLFGNNRKVEYWRMIGTWLFVAFICTLLFSMLPSNPYAPEQYMSDTEVFQRQVLSLIIILSSALAMVYFGRWIEVASYGYGPEEE